MLLGAVKGPERDVVRELLWLLNAPPDLSKLATVITNFSQVLDVAKAEWPDILAYQNLYWIPDLLMKLVPVVNKLLPQFGALIQHPGTDWLTRNALYSALRRTLLPGQELLPRYHLLQAHYFFAHAAFLTRNAERPEAPTSVAAYEQYGGTDQWPALNIDPYQASLCIRQMSRRKHSGWAKEYLEKLPIKKTPRELPPHSIVEVAGQMPEFTVQDKVNCISNYLLQVYGMKDRRANLRRGFCVRSGRHISRCRNQVRASLRSV